MSIFIGLSVNNIVDLNLLSVYNVFVNKVEHFYLRRTNRKEEIFWIK